MPVSPAREAAYQILRRVEGGRSFAVDLFQGMKISGLQEVDRKLATELVLGTLRWRGELDFQIERLSGKPFRYFDPEIAAILRLSVYQIRFLEKLPKPAVVNEAVELTKTVRKRSAAGLVNAVLRKCQPARQRPVALSRARPEAEEIQSVRRSFPAWMLERWEANFEPGAATAIAWASNVVPHTTLRVCEGERAGMQHELAAGGIRTELGKYASGALVVLSGNVQDSAALREGRVVIQDESSQLVGALVTPRAGQRVLDLCAAPGIKTRQLAAALGRGTVVACDLSSRRLRTMAQLHSGRILEAVRVNQVRLDATHDLPFGCRFDRVLVDVPCSGTGTLARNPEIKWRLQPGDLVRLAEIQTRMLSNALLVLSPGGRLVYSTCSLEPEENERVVEKVLTDSPGFQAAGTEEMSREFPALASLFDSQGYFRTRPDLHSMDGFFAAVIRRKHKAAGAYRIEVARLLL